MFGYMKNILFAMTVACGIVAVGAAYAACPAGQYPHESTGVCTDCGSGYYCPGDDTRQSCPEPFAHAPTKYPDSYQFVSLRNIYILGMSNTASESKQCIVLIWANTVPGLMFLESFYNPDSNEYDMTRNHYYVDANPGYYLTNKILSGSFLYYNQASVCLAGGYCPGHERVVNNGTNNVPDVLPNLGLEVCPNNTYSDAGATECTPCPTGWGNTGDDFASHAGAVSCNIKLCPVGEYLGADNECVACRTDFEYCPGDNIRHDCPDFVEHIRKTFPADYYNPHYTSRGAWLGRKNTVLTDCMSFLWYSSDRGEFYEYAYYNPETKLYDLTSQMGWSAVNPGYYLDEPTAPICAGQQYQYYRRPLECPVGSYCPGKAHIACPIGTTQTPTFGLESCPDDSATRVPGATSADACSPLCANGGKKLHAGEHEFNIWPNGTCSSPSIGIGLPNGTCCVNLAPGAGTGINVEWDGNIYHTVN